MLHAREAGVTRQIPGCMGGRLLSSSAHEAMGCTSGHNVHFNKFSSVSVMFLRGE